MVLPENAVILLVEDRADDIKVIQRALLKAAIYNPLIVVHDGEEALAYLDGNGKFSDRKLFPLPDLILLDLKMPRLDGFEVLAEMRKRPALKAIRVIVLTSSEDIYDVNRAYELGASSFLVKPHEFENYTNLVQTLQRFWLRQNAMPSASPQPPVRESP
ncbi:MAG: hypothetical protein AUG75_09945 [Cyanobacteria bacterium 13_1_20CM_4_61_6]|nr:MAG: hypothetical protein AUG75_09945 [Cyanobacteria bacterium 13_1_20CM_4_61_6]